MIWITNGDGDNLLLCLMAPNFDKKDYLFSLGY